MIMEKEPNLENRTYEFIGRLALVLFSQNIKMSYATLIKVLEENNLDSYGSEREWHLALLRPIVGGKTSKRIAGYQLLVMLLPTHL